MAKSKKKEAAKKEQAKEKAGDKEDKAQKEATPEPMDTVPTTSSASDGAAKKDAAEPAKDGKDAAAKKDEKADGETQMSEEDQLLKTNIEGWVNDIKSGAAAAKTAALTNLRAEIMTVTTSMTSVPKPLKFLLPHYKALKEAFEAQGSNKTELADILSVLAMTAQEESREMLKFKLRGNVNELEPWGHEFVRNLAGEVAAEFGVVQEKGESTTVLESVADNILRFDMKHAAETDACDLLLEIHNIGKILEYIDTNNVSRVASYLLQCAQYEPEENILEVVYDSFMKVNKVAEALRVAIRLGSEDRIKQAITAASGDKLLTKQLMFDLGKSRLWVPDMEDELMTVMGNTTLSQHFLTLANDLNVTEAKTPEDIYKSHLETVSRGSTAATLDSARKNLASTFVNAFVNAGFGTDKLVTIKDSDWLYKNKEHGMMSAVASQGMIQMWDWEGGASDLAKYLYSNEPYIQAGAMIAIGMVNNGIRTEYDAAYSLLEEKLAVNNDAVKSGVAMGLGIAYASAKKTEAMELLVPVVVDRDMNIEVSGIAALSLGMIFVGSCDVEIASSMLQVLLERDETALKSPFAKYVALGIGLLYLSKQDEVEVVLELMKAIPVAEVREAAVLTVEICAYAGTGNVLKIQKMLHACSDHIENEAAAQHQPVAVLGIAIIAMGEDLGAEMALRAFNHLLQYGELPIRRAVPLALGLLCVSNPNRITVVDTLSKLSHDPDAEVSQNAIFAIGLVGAGSNNARMAGMLRELAAYYSKEANHLFVVRLAQGLLYMGKGTMTLSPLHSDRLLLSPVALSGLLSVVFGALDMKSTILGKAHYLLYYLSLSMTPRMLLTLDEELKPLRVPVRVGQAVDVVGQAGKPKTITGFQTHNSPVLIASGERAELVNDKYIPLNPVLEGIVVLKLNPDFVQEEEEPAAKGKK